MRDGSEYVGSYWLDEHGHRYYVQGWSKDGDSETVRLVHVQPRDQTVSTRELKQRFLRDNPDPEPDHA